MMKRCFDIVVSAIGLVLLSPLLVVCAIMIKRDSEGPVFFRQVRVGLGGSTFRIHKFRTMRVNAESIGEQLTAASDPRITQYGQFLRRHKLDELPQLIDVLIGNMSMVGPRPEVPRFVEYYPEAIKKIVLSVKPGITDLASIRFRNESELLSGEFNTDYYVTTVLPKKLDHYVEYVNQQSLWLDIKILALTLRALFA